MRTIPFLLTETNSCVQRVFFKFSYQLTSCQLFTVLCSKNGGVWVTVANICMPQRNFKILLTLLRQCQLFNIILICFFSIRGVWKKRRKKCFLHVLSIPSAVSGVLVWTMDENEKQIQCSVEWTRISVESWKGSKMLLWWGSYFASFSSKWKRGPLKIH